MAIIVDNKFNELHNEVGVVPLTQLINYGYPSKELGDLLGKEPITLVGLYKKETVIFYANRDYLVELGEYIGDKSKKDILFFRDLYKKSEELKKETVDILHKLGRQEISKYSNEEIINFINKLTKNGFVMSILSLVGAIADHVHDIFYNLMDFTIANAKNINKAKLNKIEILNLLTTPIWLMPSEKAKLELIKIKRVKDGKKQDLAIKNFLDKWHWLYHGHLGPGMTKKDVKEELEGDIKVEDKEKIIKKQRDLENKIFTSKEEKNIFETARIFIYLKGMRAEVCNGIFSFLNLAIKKIEKDENIDQKFLWYLSVSELMNYLKNKVLPAKNELRERRKFSVWIFKDPYVGKIYTGDSAREFLLKNTIKEKHDIKNSSEIKGNVAYPGKVNGKVKIVNSVKEMVKMKRGDIMVSVQTMPELLPAMKKAVAFVTDMGGITSHAAIVSREMKVPCIVGTRSATKILKDGDRVEVDANIGIVKKI